MKNKHSLEMMLDEPVDLASLIEKPDFSEENIIEANREQPQLFLEASRYRVKKMRSRIQSESSLETEKAKASLFFRAKKKDKGTTEPYIKAKIITDKAVQEAQQAFDKQLVYEEWAKQLLETYRYRGRAIQTLAELLGAEANAQARMARKDLELAGYENLKTAVKKKYHAVEE
jgi:hypothetical protein